MNKTNITTILFIVMTLGIGVGNTAQAEVYDTFSTERQSEVYDLIRLLEAEVDAKTEAQKLIKVTQVSDDKLLLKQTLIEHNRTIYNIVHDLEDYGVILLDTFNDSRSDHIEAMNQHIEQKYGYHLEVEDEPMTCDEACRTINFKIGYYYQCFEHFVCGEFALTNIGTYIDIENTQSIEVSFDEHTTIVPFHIVYSEFDQREIQYNVHADFRGDYGHAPSYWNKDFIIQWDLYDAFDRAVFFVDEPVTVSEDSIMTMILDVEEISPILWD